jgi:hypothetical protein
MAVWRKRTYLGITGLPHAPPGEDVGSEHRTPHPPTYF